VSLTAKKKLAALKELSRRYNCDWIEYDEKISQPLTVLYRLDMENMHRRGWFPYRIENERATVITPTPGEEVAADVRARLGVKEVAYLVTLPGDLERIIDHNMGLNPGFIFASGRTPLARVRTYLAGRRSLLAHYRTLFAKGRTGLAFIRTGLAAVSIALLFLRSLGGGPLLFLEIPLIVIGVIMVFDGLKWYLPARRIKPVLPKCVDTGATNGTTVLTVSNEKEFPEFSRSAEIPGAAELRRDWTAMTPVMRRRYLASDRTDYAEGRTVFACMRTHMAKTRTGLAFIRTGITFASLGFGLYRHFSPGNWIVFDLALMIIGSVMVVEGFLWFPSGFQAGKKGICAVLRIFSAPTVWDDYFPTGHRATPPGSLPGDPPVADGDRPGIWGTTGHALDRTLLAERRNVMSMLRTVMARERTGMAFIRTGRSFIFIGLAFLLFFGPAALGWDVFSGVMIAIGLLLVGDGLYWTLPTERIRKQFPYCFGGMEITGPDYATPPAYWSSAVFSHD